MLRLALAGAIIVLVLIFVRRRVVHVDLTLPWLAGFLVLAATYSNPITDRLMIAALDLSLPVYVALILSLGLLLGLALTVNVVLGQEQKRQIALLRRIAGNELAASALASGTRRR
ncbi:MAG: hypothetical protein FJX47_15310 [Alphaproteobacteria bacterium]|nr:hypothetical protein [Alphaproteobacteria bacterium]